MRYGEETTSEVCCPRLPARAVVMNSKLQMLPFDERIKLVEDLWDSIASDRQALALTTEQRAELDRRLDAYELDKNRGQLATDVVTSIRSRL
jgi:putative addiction module component (TIGR02574 family)